MRNNQRHMTTQEWRCPYCGLTMDAAHVETQDELSTVREACAQGPCTFRLMLTVCPSLSCRALTARIAVYPLVTDINGAVRLQGEPARTWNLLPPSSAKPMPEYVPERITKEYADACAVLEVSPSAAATLARRCLQAIIRDFYGVKKNTLADELDAVKEKLDPELWTLIDETRHAGNIGKNMEKGVNLILDADPGEAQRLIGVIECLIDECYVSRHERKQRLDAMRHSRGPA
jgi:Domain of unknown function (DUF4145)